MVEHDSDFGFRHQLRRVTIRLDGELDLSRIDELDRALTPASSLSGAELIVDVTGVTFIDTAVITWLLCTRDKLAHRNGRIRVVAAPESAMEKVLALTGLHDEITVDLSNASATRRQRPARVHLDSSHPAGSSGS